MIEKTMAENNKIIEIKNGSHLYGLNTPKSDLDYIGIFIPYKEYILGLKNIEEVDLSIKDKLDNKKNSKDAIDRKLYEFRKYIKLALANNPNITELLFVDEPNVIFINGIGKELLKLKHEFLHKGLKERFIGYAISQKKKMIIKKDNYFALKEALELINKIVENDDGKLLLPQCYNIDNFSKLFLIKNDTDNHYRVGDRSIVKNMTVKRAKQELEEIINMATNRKELIEENGFDYKFAGHLIRLLLEGIELLETGNLVFPLINKKELMDIKTGKWTLQEVLDYSEELESKINDVYNKTKLPNNPNFTLIENFMMEVLRDAINK
jgi:predicted nucleotidyltransferase